MNFSTAQKFDEPPTLSARTRRLLHSSTCFYTRPMLATSPEEHARLRSIFAARLSPRRNPRLGTLAEAIATELVDALPTDVADLVAGLARPLPFRIAMKAVGIPSSAFDLVSRGHQSWMDLLGGELDDEAAVNAALGLGAFDTYLRDLVLSRTAAPAADIATDFARAVASGSCRMDEAVANLRFVIAGGCETVAHTLANTLFHLLSQPHLWERVAADSSLAERAAEEGLRLDPGSRGTGRNAVNDVLVDGVSIPAGAPVQVMTSTPGLDGTRFPRPTSFDLDRPSPEKHMAFGHGPYYCTGSALARLELTTAIRVLARRRPKAHLPPGFTPTFVSTTRTMRGVATLPVRFTRCRAPVEI